NLRIICELIENDPGSARARSPICLAVKTEIKSLATNVECTCRPCVQRLPFKRHSTHRSPNSMQEHMNRLLSKLQHAGKAWPCRFRREASNAVRVLSRTNCSGWPNPSAYLKLFEKTKHNASTEREENSRN